MRCDRCGYSVPEWLWIAGDHPILVQAATKIENVAKLDQNIFRVSTTETVQIKLCSEANPGSPVENAQRRFAEASAKAGFHIPDWMCEKCKTQYPDYVARINCCPTHNMVVCYKCKDELHPEEVSVENASLTAVCPNCSRSVDVMGEHWQGEMLFDRGGFWKCEPKEV